MCLTHNPNYGRVPISSGVFTPANKAQTLSSHPQAYIQPPASHFHLHREGVYGLSQPLGRRDSIPTETRASPEQSSF